MLHLPRAADTASYNQVSFRFHHKVNAAPRDSGLLEPHLIFSPGKGIFTIILHMWASGGGQFYLITIHLDALLRCAGAFDSSLNGPLEGGSTTVPWEDWGSKFSSCERVHEAWWDKQIDHFGQRQALFMPHAIRYGSQLFVRDYNPLTVSYYLSNPCPSSVEVITGERRTSGGPYFREDIVSCLPFVQSVGIPRAQSDEHLWMDQDHLVAVSVRD